MDIWIALPIMLLLLFIKGFFSGSEIALVSADKVKLRYRAKKGDKGAQKVLKAFRHPDKLLSITLIGTNLATISLTTIGTMLMISLFGEAGDLIAFAVFTPLLLIFGEIVPKSVMQQVSDKVTPIIIYPLGWFGTLVHPIVWCFSKVARFAAKLAGSKTSSSIFLSREQLKTIVDMAEQSDSLKSFEQGSISRIIRFADTTAAEEMVPMNEVFGINSDHSMAEALARTRSSGKTRFPVYKETASNISAIALIEPWDLMDPNIENRALEEFTTAPLFISPFQSVEEIFPLLSQRKDRMGVVVDEFGSALGLITLEDLISSIVGDVYVGLDDKRRHRRDNDRYFRKAAPGSYEFDARFPLAEVNKIASVKLPMKDFNSLAGLISTRLRHIAKEGDSIVEDGVTLTVIEASDKAIHKVRLDT